MSDEHLWQASDGPCKQQAASSLADGQGLLG